jgi:peptide/nickel transport system permease protein
LSAQYVSWLTGLSRGDLGRSILTRKPVTQEILRALPATLTLGAASFLAAVSLAVPAGLLASLTRGRRPDRALRVLSLAGVSTPNYVLAPLLVLVFSVGLGILPVSGREGARSLVLPAATLGLSMAALLSRMVRASVSEELSRPYFLAALARGETRLGAALLHAGRNALPPILVVAGLQIGSLLTGAVVTETIFSWPGIGRLLIQSIQRRDTPMVQGCVLFIAAVYTVVNAAVDLLIARLDPRAQARADEKRGMV